MKIDRKKIIDYLNDQIDKSSRALYHASDWFTDLINNEKGKKAAAWDCIIKLKKETDEEFIAYLNKELNDKQGKHDLLDSLHDLMMVQEKKNNKKRSGKLFNTDDIRKFLERELNKANDEWRNSCTEEEKISAYSKRMCALNCLLEIEKSEQVVFESYVNKELNETLGKYSLLHDLFDFIEKKERY